MWNFREYQEGEVIHNSHEEEFFTMQIPLQSVVREAVQNSLDAALPGVEKVTVRFLYGRASKGAGEVFLGLKDHIISSGIMASGLGDSGFDFLAVEDFNTTGLTGPTSYRECVDKGDGNFCNFWWVDGSTRKDMKKGGRWGLGKYSFFVFSRLKLFFGVSVPDSDNNPLIMGRALLKRHNTNQRTYSPEGVFATSGSEPIRDSSIIEKFHTYFELERRTSPGLSIVIPYPDFENRLSVYSDIVYHVLDNYLYSVAAGNLEVKIEDRVNSEREQLIINKNSLKFILQNFLKTDKRFKEFEKIYELYKEILSCKDPDFVLKIADKDFPQIDEQSFMGIIYDARKKYSNNSNTIIKIRIPFWINRKDLDKEFETYVDVSISTNSAFKDEKVHCIRNGIKVIRGIPDFKMTSGIMVLIAEDDPASELLGDSENPSHTEWNPRTERLKNGKYLSPDKVLKFIKGLPRDLVRILSEIPEYEDKDVLADIFYAPENKTRTIKHVNPIPPVPPPRPSLRIFDLVKHERGFRLTLTKNGQETLPREITIKTAYDTVEGDPFKNYSKFDYIIGSEAVRIAEFKGGEMLELGENKIKVRAEDKDFIIVINGFDSRRDLIVDIKSRGFDGE